jgi:tetratricopeptide (TPR) repeat protein
MGVPVNNNVCILPVIAYAGTPICTSTMKPIKNFMDKDKIASELERLKYNPESLPNLQKEAEDCVRRKEYLEAYAILSRIEELYEPTSQLLVNKSLCLIRLQELNEALVTLEESMKLDPENQDAIKLKGMIEQKLDRLRKYWGVQQYG